MAKSTNLKPLVFIAGPEEQATSNEICGKFIAEVEGHPMELKAYILQQLLESFEKHYDVDIRGGYSVHEDEGKA